MSVSGAIVRRFDDDVDDDIVALQTALGEDKAWTDKAPEETAMPYMVVKQIGTVVESETKGQAKRIMNTTIQIDVWETAGDVDSILDLIEEAYIGHTITITNRSHLSTHLNNRFPEQRKKNLWRGFIEFNVQYEKSS